MAVSDREVVEQVLQGNRDVFANLVDRYQDRLRRVLSSFCVSSADVEDYLQEAFVQAYCCLGRFRPEDPFFPWLRGIAVNTVRMGCRKEVREQDRMKAYAQRLQMLRSEEDTDGAIAEERARALDICLGMLRDTDSEIMKSRYEEGQSIARLAEQFRTTVSAMKVRLLRLREALGNCIRKRMRNPAGSGVAR